MIPYIIRRLLLILPTLLGIMLINFVVLQFAPGGPIEQILAELKGTNISVSQRVGGSGDFSDPTGEDMLYRGAENLDPEFIAELEIQFGFDKPPQERFLLMVGNYLTFDFGQSYFRDRKVIDMIADKLPVSITLGFWTTIIIYLISIPLGIRKAIKDGSKFDFWTSSIIFIGYAIPSFVLSIVMIVLFAGDSFWNIFPLRGLVSDDWQNMSWYQQILDYLWHIAVPIFALVSGGFAWLTMLTKNSFIDQLSQHYVLTARAKGLSEKRVIYGHVFRNAMLIVISGMPSALIGILFTGVLMIELIFSLDGLGLMGFEAAVSRDYPVVFATLYISSLIGLSLRLISDIIYTFVDPRIHFGSYNA
ncbi:MAG: microcin C ABC transporter permease YejB [Emcibacteraceae bacterium]|nr:microcin C ABC transporter permease YejB [Emcibacteraceae bacterium]